MITKVCGKCGIEKDFSQYKKAKNGKYGLYSICKDCVKERDKTYRDSHKEHKKEYSKEYYLKHHEEKLSYNRQYREENRDKILSHKKEYDSNIRNKALDLYGYKCELCGSVDFLEFHHLNLDGEEERKVYSSKNLYKSLSDGNKRNDLQLLCRSCHHRIHNNLRSSI